MSDKPSDDKERPRSSKFSSRSEDKEKEEEKKTGERPPLFGGKPASSIFGKPTASEPSKPSSTSTFGRPAQMPPKPSTTTGSTPKAESKPASSGSGSTSGSRPGTGMFDTAKPADPAPPKPESPPKPSTPKPEEKKPGGLFSGFGRGGGKPEEKKEPPKPASSAAPARIGTGTTAAPKAEPPSRSAAPAKKPADAEQPKRGFPNLGALFGRGKKEEADKPAKPADASKIGTGKPAPVEAPKSGGGLFSRLQGEKPSEPPKDQPKPATATGATPRFGDAAATPPKADPKKDDKKPEQSAKGGFFSRLRRGGAAKPESGASAAPLKTPAPIDGKRGGSSIPGAPPARGEKQAKPLEGQTHVTVKNVGLSLDQKLDMIGWLLIVTGVVMIFGLIQPDEGTFTKAIVDIFGALFGYGRYVLPLPCLAVGGWLLVRYFKKNPFLTFDALQMTGAVLLFLSIVTGLHTIELIDKIVYDWDELIAVSARAVDLMQGGGWVGDRLYMILIRLTGEFGVPVVLAITTFIGTLWLFELSLAEIATYIKSSFQIFGARTGRIRESWRAWRQTVAARRAAQAAARAQVRAQREAATLAAQAQGQPKPAAGLPAAATLAHTADLPEQPVLATVGAEQTPPARKAAFRTSIVAPAVAVAQPPSEETPLPAPAIAKPAPLGARSTPVQTAAQPAAQPTAFSVPVAEASPTAAPEKPAEKPKTGSFGGIFGGGKPKSEPAPDAPTVATPTATAPVDSEPPDLSVTQPTRATGVFKTPTPAPKPVSSIFGSKPKPAEPQPAEDAEDEDVPVAKAPPPPAKPASGIFGSKPASSPFGSPSAFRPAPKPTSEQPAVRAPQPEDAADDLEDMLDDEDDAHSAPLPPERVPTSAPASRIFGSFGGAKPTEKSAEPSIGTPVAAAVPPSSAELPPMQHLPGDTTWPMPDYRELLQSGSVQTITEEMLAERRRLIEETLEAFGAPGRVVETNVGPTITQFGVEPGYLNSRGKQTRIKVNQIAKLDADLALALAARSIRIEAPVPGKGYVGIEVPNPETSLVGLRDIIGSSTFNQMRSRLRVALGKSIDGAAVVSDLTQMPHMLIAGTTGSGKSVCVNAVIACLLLQNSPDDLKLIMVDPKRVELTGYNGIPHLVSPVVVDLERVTGVLKWVTREMDERYKKFAASGARNITDYNSKIGATEPRMPYLVVIIDELADLMMLAPDETEKQLTRLAQMARATGIHLIISTQRPSVDVVTGLIKANFPARISFAVASSVDSRVILDQPGAEKLLGRGDMLYQAPDAAAPIRVQGVYVSDAELKQITDFWKAAQKERGTPLSSVSFDHAPDKPTAKLTKPGESAPFQPRTERFGSSSPFGAPKFAPPRPQPSPENDAFFAAVRGDAAEDEAVDDALYEKAVELYRQNNGKISVMILQTRLKVGYRHAESIYKLMRERGVVKNTDSGDDNADA